MANNPNDRPGRAQPNESENQPGYESEDEAQRGGQKQSQGGVDDPTQRQGGFGERKKDEVSSPSPGGVDPDRAWKKGAHMDDDEL